MRDSRLKRKSINSIVWITRKSSAELSENSEEDKYGSATDESRSFAALRMTVSCEIERIAKGESGFFYATREASHLRVALLQSQAQRSLPKRWRDVRDAAS